jgi:SAM-dependent methyltransferase
MKTGESVDPLDSMTAFYNLFPYPNRPLFAFPNTCASAPAMAGFAQACASPVFADQCLTLWKQSKVPNQFFSLAEPYSDEIRSLVSEKCHIGLVGCGTDELLFMRSLHPKAQIVGFDLSAKSLKIAERKERFYKFYTVLKTLRTIDWGKTTTAQGDATDQLSKHKKSFHHIQCFGVLHHQKTPEVLLRRMSESLRNDGTIRLMIYSETGRKLERRLQQRYKDLWEMKSLFKLVLISFWLWLWNVSKLVFSSRSSVSTRFRYLGGSRVSVADALLHPSDPGLTLSHLKSWCDDLNLKIVFCEAKDQECSWLMGCDANSNTDEYWRRICESERRGTIISNITLILKKGFQGQTE